MEEAKIYECPPIREKVPLGRRIAKFIICALVGYKNFESWSISELLLMRHRTDMGLSKHTQLRITPQYIQLIDYGMTMKSIRRDRVHINCYAYQEALFFVFSEEAIEQRTKKELWDLIKAKKAFCFPYVVRAQEDFPDIFVIK